MVNISIEKLGQVALNDTKPRQASKARSYINAKAHQVLGRTPNSLAEAVLAIMKYRSTGEMAK